MLAVVPLVRRTRVAGSLQPFATDLTVACALVRPWACLLDSFAAQASESLSCCGGLTAPDPQGLPQHLSTDDDETHPAGWWVVMRVTVTRHASRLVDGGTWHRRI